MVKFKISKSNLICMALSVLVCVSIFSGCSNSSDSKRDETSRNNASYATTTAATAPAKVTNGGFADGEYDIGGVMYENATSADMASESAPIANTKYEEKIIKNASLTMESLDVEKAYAELLDFVSSKGGYEFSREMSVKKDETTVYATFKVPPAALDEILRSASGFADVLSSNVSSDDISADYYDYKVRLENKRKNLEKYYEFLESAKTVEEMITLQNQIDFITADIESYEGKIKVWDSLVDNSTISVKIFQKDDPDEIVEEVEWDTLTFSKVGRMMKNGFTKTCNVIFSVIQWIMVIFVSILPVIVIVAIVIIIVIVRKSKKKKKAELSNQKNIESNKEE